LRVSAHPFHDLKNLITRGAPLHKVAVLFGLVARLRELSLAEHMSKADAHGHRKDQAEGAKPGSEYHEFVPPVALRGYFVCFWTQTIHSKIRFAQRVLPDCCGDILLVNEVPMVVGPWSEAFVAALAPGTTIVGARCHPGLLESVLGMPASEVRNQYAPLRAVWRSSEADCFSRIAEELTLSGRLVSLELALHKQLAKARPANKVTIAAIQWMARHPFARVEQLSQFLSVSRRQVQRRFTDAVGYGPKLFQSVLRFQRLLHLSAIASGRQRLALLAADAGYADQAHMTREVQRFSGQPPRVLLQGTESALRLSGLLREAEGLDS
jgi:AraC-like DNA-binding protein